MFCFHFDVFSPELTTLKPYTNLRTYYGAKWNAEQIDFGHYWPYKFIFLLFTSEYMKYNVEN